MKTEDTNEGARGGPSRGSLAAAAVAAVLFAAGAVWFGDEDRFGSRAGIVFLLGGAFGYVLQRSRFCFLCILRDFFEERDARGILGILAALAVGLLGYLVLMSSWVYDPSAGHTPPGAHIGPVSWVLVLGGLVFGWGMALSGSCISAQLYRLGEGSVLSPVALAGTAAGFVLGFLAWNTLYLRALATAPVVWLPERWGYGGALAVSFLVLGAAAVWLLTRLRPEPAEPGEALGAPPYTLRTLLRAVFVRRWPAWAGGIFVGLIAAVAYYRAEPLGVTAQIGSWSRQAGTAAGVVPGRMEGLDGFAGCATAVGAHWLSENGIFITGLVLAGFVGGLASGRFRLQRKRPAEYALALLGGVFLGFGSMISLGCTVGTLLSGIHAMALSGWVFAAFVVLGVWTGLPLKRRFESD
ncbi:MAG: YeeE/YedE family protein [Opitutales bacterium]|nr:YeeE/YedE family protein [Opitutales bacterium]